MSVYQHDKVLKNTNRTYRDNDIDTSRWRCTEHARLASRAFYPHVLLVEYIFSQIPDNLTFELSIDNSNKILFAENKICARVCRSGYTNQVNADSRLLLVPEAAATRTFRWRLSRCWNTSSAATNTGCTEHLVSFAQWRYRNQWGSTEVRLLLVENFYQYPAMTMWNTIGYGNFWKFLRKLVR